MSDVVEVSNVRVLKGGGDKNSKTARPRSAVVIEICPDGTIGKTFVNCAEEDCIEMLGALAMAHIRILNILQGR